MITINELDFFGIASSEIHFFILHSLLICLCLKYKKPSDYIFLGIFISSFILKIFLIIKNSSKDNFALLGIMTLDATIFNHNFFIFGILFGEVNYIIQKSIKNKKIIEITWPNILMFAFNISKFLNNINNMKFKKSFLILFNFIVLFFLSLCYSIYNYLLGLNLKGLLINNFLKVFYSVDS